MEFSMEQAQEVLEKGMDEAKEVIANPSKVDEILQMLEEKLKAVPVIGSTLSDLPLMIAMIKAWVKKEYTVVSPKEKDLISDSISVVGHLDDLAVLGLALKLSEPELKAFSEWRAGGETL